jgi:hypothetical protein
MTENEEEVVGEEEVEEEEEEKPKKEKGSVVVDIDLDDALYKEALKDVLAINEAIPSEPDVKSPELREYIAFKEECEALMSLMKPYVKNKNFDILSDEFDLKKAMEIAKEMIGPDGSEEVIEGEPSPYVQELFKKLWQKYVDCKWFEAMMKGRKPITPKDLTKDLKFQKAPEDLLKIEGEKI